MQQHGSAGKCKRRVRPPANDEVVSNDQKKKKQKSASVAIGSADINDDIRKSLQMRALALAKAAEEDAMKARADALQRDIEKGEKRRRDDEKHKAELHTEALEVSVCVMDRVRACVYSEISGLKIAKVSHHPIDR